MDSAIQSSAIRVVILIGLLAVLSFVLVHFNVVSCGFYSPLGCDIYYSLIQGGSPKVMIVTGNEGIGNPEFLYETLRGPKFKARATLKDIETVSLPLLQENEMVIVEKATRMSVADIKMFMDYVNLGGKLVWIGDAGTKAPQDEQDLNYFLKYEHREEGGSGSYIGPWARRDGDYQVSLDYLLGVNYKANYCDVEDCGLITSPGEFIIIDSSENLVNGIAQGLPFYGNFSIVSPSGDSYSSTLALMDYGMSLTGSAPEGSFWLGGGTLNFGEEFPVIVSSGLGGRVAYYAFPLEYLVSDAMPLDKETGERIAYWALLENMYYGMLYK